MSIVFDHVTHPQRVLFGTGRVVENVETAVASLGSQRALLIAGASSAAVVNKLHAKLPMAATIRDVLQHVPSDNATAAVELAEQHRIDLVVAVGGGSAIGLAKIVARDTGIPILAVPTTFSGSEATDIWGITSNGLKSTGKDLRVLPKVVVYDAELTRTLPVELAMASGLNAVAHAVDGFWAPGADPINHAIGLEGLRALVPALRSLVKEPDDLLAHEQILYGAYLAAVAFASSGSGLHHKICHALGGTFNLPHAETHSVMIRHVAAFNSAVLPDVAGRLSAVLEAESVENGFQKLQKDLGTPASLAELGFRETEIAKAAEIIFPSIPASNPRQVSEEMLQELLHAGWLGEPQKHQ